MGFVRRGGLIICGRVVKRVERGGTTIQMAIIYAPKWAIIGVVIALYLALNLGVR